MSARDVIERHELTLHPMSGAQVTTLTCTVGQRNTERLLVALDAAGYAIVPKEPTEAIALIAAERNRQVQDEGWSSDHDDHHTDGSIARAAACYAMSAAGLNPISHWPWHPAWWKPKSKKADLVRAAALIVAEIERLGRAAKESK